MTPEEKQKRAEELRQLKAEEKHSKKAFNALVSMAKRKGALVSVDYNFKP